MFGFCLFTPRLEAEEHHRFALCGGLVWFLGEGPQMVVSQYRRAEARRKANCEARLLFSWHNPLAADDLWPRIVAFEWP